MTYFLNALLQTSQHETQQVKIKIFQTAPLKPTAVEYSQAKLNVCKKDVENVLVMINQDHEI